MQTDAVRTVGNRYEGWILCDYFSTCIKLSVRLSKYDVSVKSI